MRVAPSERREHVQQRADFGVDERQILARAVRGHLREHRIDEVIQSRKVAFDGVWNDLAHNEKRIV